jgi:hypothetical protein
MDMKLKNKLALKIRHEIWDAKQKLINLCKTLSTLDKPLAAATMKNEEDKVSGTLLPSSAAEASQSPFHYFEVSAGEVPGFYRALSSLRSVLAFNLQLKLP